MGDALVNVHVATSKLTAGGMEKGEQSECWQVYAVENWKSGKLAFDGIQLQSVWCCVQGLPRWMYLALVDQYLVLAPAAADFPGCQFAWHYCVVDAINTLQ